MRYLRSMAKIIVYMGVAYLCIHLFVSFAAYSYYKSTETPHIRTNEAGNNWVSGGTFSEGNGSARSLFGKVNLSFTQHCYPTAQSYFDAGIAFTEGLMMFLLVPGSAVLLIVLKLKKFHFSFASVIMVGIVVSIVSFGALQLWLTTNASVEEKGTLKILHPMCY